MAPAVVMGVPTGPNATGAVFANERNDSQLRKHSSKNESRGTEGSLGQEFPEPEANHEPGTDKHEPFQEAHAVAFGAKEQIYQRKSRENRPRNKVYREKGTVPLRHESDRKIETHHRMHPKHQREKQPRHGLTKFFKQRVLTRPQMRPKEQQR
jgi:hypothetical protein